MRATHGGADSPLAGDARLGLLYASLAPAAGANVLLAAVLLGILWPVVDVRLGLTWLLAMLLVQALRLGLWRQRNRARKQGGGEGEHWLRRFRLGAVGTGAIWGAGAWLLFPEASVAHQALLAFILAGVCAGAVTTLASDARSALGFVVAALVPLIFAFLLRGGEMSLALGGMVVVFLAYVAASGRSLRKALRDNHLLLDNARLQQAALDRQHRLGEVLARAQSLFITEDDRRKAFDALLVDVLALTGSAYGFIGEVLRRPGGALYLKTHAITNIAWNDETRAFYDAHAPGGMEFDNLDTLFGAALRSGAPVIANNPGRDPRSGGLPEGHPALEAFLGIPVHHGGELVAMLGLANRSGGYDEALIEFLAPLLAAVGQLVVAARVRQQHRADRIELARLSRVASETTNGVVITDVEGRTEWINEGFTRLTGYARDELLGRKPGELLQGAATDPQVVAGMHEALARGEHFEVDVLNYTKGGRPYWVRVSCNPLRDDAGGLQGFIAIESDVTREKEDAERIRDSERQFRSLVAHIPGVTCRCRGDAQRTILYVSDQVEALCGWSARELIDKPERGLVSVVHPEDAPALAATLDAALAAGQDWVVEYRVLHRDGAVRWVQERGTVVRDGDGGVRFLDALIFDVTEDRTNRDHLQRQLAALAALNDIASMAATAADEQLRRALHLGAEYLALEVGIVSRIRDNDYEVESCVAPAGVPLASGQHFTLGGTYCDLALACGELVAIERMGESAHRGHPCYTEFGLESYIGVVVEVQGRTYGTLSFSSPAARGTPFSDGERMFVRLLARWVGAVIERQQWAHRLQLNEARLRGLFELSPIGIALNDVETGAFVELNEALLRPTGYTREEFVELSYWDLTPREYEAQERVQLERLENEGRYGPYEKEYLRKDGSRYPVLLNGMLVRDPSGRKLIWSIIEDVSERKRMERMKNEFIATVSHELRTPLTAISGALGLVVGGVTGELPAQAREMLAIAHKNSQRLGILINDLLDMEKLVAGRMRFDMQIQPLAPLLAQAVRDNEAYARTHGARLELAHDGDRLCVDVDGQRLQQVMANLLSNAAKFSPEGGVVTVWAEAAGAWVRVSVMDRGCGIPAEFRERIFDKFAQADASDSRRKGGTGLGLAITRELVERMGGRIGFDSIPGQGTRFHVDLPVAAAADGALR